MLTRNDITRRRGHDNIVPSSQNATQNDRRFTDSISLRLAEYLSRLRKYNGTFL
jgi:hypothetical protein